jgi:NADPH:quinone reductase-like Zn-dependent oxidoreductase
MKAIRIATFGGPEVLQLEEIARPIPAADEVLVQVMACGVNRAEMRIRSGSINDRMPVPLPWTPGSDFAGTVAAVGADVTTFQPGEEVYG